YASDPYWGEKAAQYFYEMDHAMGDQDHNRYALGIVKSSGVSIYKNADTKSDVIYRIKKGYDAALILLEKVENKDGSWYRVQSDPSLDSKQKQSDGTYNFKNSYGFIKAEDVASVLNSKRIQEKSYVDITFDANGGTFYPNDKKITLQVKPENTGDQAPVKDHALFSSWDIQLKPAEEPLTYEAAYKCQADCAGTDAATTYDLNESSMSVMAESAWILRMVQVRRLHDHRYGGGFSAKDRNQNTEGDLCRLYAEL
ncbi:MAG: SH3 domain-containing protein, partial [Clostridium sp.]